MQISEEGDYLSQSDISSQMLKGILQGCLLLLINHQPYYGYAISQELSKYGFTDVPKGTIYPLLMNMEKKGLSVKLSLPKRAHNENITI